MQKSISLLLIFINLTFGICHLTFAQEFILAPNDQLEIKLIGQNGSTSLAIKDLDTKQTIAPDGTLSLPLLDRITAQGQALGSFNKYLSTEFAKYIENPQVVVYLTPRHRRAGSSYLRHPA